MDQSAHRHIVVITGSAPIAGDAVRSIPPDALLIAADGGLDRALAAGLRPDVLVGDLDSISESGLTWAERDGGGRVEVERHPVDKDATDTELALAAAAVREPSRITLIGGGDRLDHSLAAIGATGAPGLAAVERVDGWWDGNHFEVLHGPSTRALLVDAGSTISLLALQGPCGGVSLAGTRWTLDAVELGPVVGLGVSNVAVGGTVTVTVRTGVLTVFDVPDDTTAHTRPRPEDLDR